MSNAYYWRCLVISVFLEVVGVSVMKLSQDIWPVFGLAVMYILLGLSYFCLAQAILRLPVGASYAFWEGVGLVLMTGVSVLLLGEALEPMRLVALSMILTGVLFVHHGTEFGGDDLSVEQGRA